MPRPPRWPWLGLLLSISGLASAQQDDPAAALAADRATADSTEAAERLEALLARDDLPAPLRLEAEQLRPALWLQQGRRDDAQAAWQARRRAKL